MTTMQIGLAMFVGMLALMAVRVPIAIGLTMRLYSGAKTVWRS